MDPKLGPSFLSELQAAGLGDIAISWEPATGIIHGVENLPEDVQQKLAAVVAAHDPTRQAPVTATDFLGFMALFTDAEQDLIFASTDTQVRKFVAMAAGSGTITLADPRVAGGVNYLAAHGLISTSRVASVLAGTPPPAPVS